MQQDLNLPIERRPSRYVDWWPEQYIPDERLFKCPFCGAYSIDIEPNAGARSCCDPSHRGRARKAAESDGVPSWLDDSL